MIICERIVAGELIHEVTMERQTAENIISDIIEDLTDRKGLRQGWEQIGEDIQIEIFEAWQDIVLKGDK